MKKMIAFLLTVTLLLTLLPTNILATEEVEAKVPVTTLYVGTENALENPEGDGWSFDVDSGVLTLNNCTLTESKLHIFEEVYDDYVEYKRIDAMIYFEGDLTIELIGNNFVERDITEAPTDYTYYYAICAAIYETDVDNEYEEGELWDRPSELTIQGTGNLTSGIAITSDAVDIYGDMTDEWYEYLCYSAGIGCWAENYVDLSGLHDGGWVDVYGGIYGVEAPWELRAFACYPTFGDNCIVTAYRDLECTIENENGYNWNNNDAWRMKVTTPNAHLSSKGLLTLLASGSASGEGWTWENNELTLSEGTAVKAIDFRSGLNGAKLTLDGDVILDSSNMEYDANWDYIPAIKAACDLEIDTDEYSLTLNHHEYGYGIRVQQADLLISGGTVMSLTNYDTSIYSEGGNVTVENATLLAFGEVVLCDYNYEDQDWNYHTVPGGDLLISNAVVELYGGAYTNSGDLNVIDSDLYAWSESYSDGLSCDYADMLFQNSDVTIIAPGTLIEAAYGTVTFDNCNLNLQMTESSSERDSVILAAYYSTEYEDDEDATEHNRWEPDLDAITFRNMSVTVPASWEVSYTEEEGYWDYITVGNTILVDDNGDKLAELQAVASSSTSHTASEKIFEYTIGTECEGGKKITIVYCTCGDIYSRTETIIEAKGHGEYKYVDDAYSGHDIYCKDCGEWVTWDNHTVVDGSCVCGHECEASYYDSYDEYHIGYCNCGEELSQEEHSHYGYDTAYYEHCSICACGVELSDWSPHVYDEDTHECVCGYWTEVLVVFDYNGGYENYNGVNIGFWHYPASMEETLDGGYFDANNWYITREGYRLIGFTTVKDDASTLFTDEYTLTDDVTFYALWASDSCEHNGTDRIYEPNANDGTNQVWTHTVICDECRMTIDESEECSGDDACQSCERVFCNHDSDNKTYTPNMHYGDDSPFTHKVVCNDCNMLVSSAEECSGGTACCFHLAICQYCGREYGDYAPLHQLTASYQETITPDENGMWNHGYTFTIPNTGKITITVPQGGDAVIDCDYYNWNEQYWLDEETGSITFDVRPTGVVTVDVYTYEGATGVWEFTYTRTVGCEHENTVFVSNGDGTHREVCTDETCNEVWEAFLECRDEDNTGYCDYCGNKICSEEEPHELELPYESDTWYIYGDYTFSHHYCWTADADGTLTVKCPQGDAMYCMIYLNGIEDDMFPEPNNIGYIHVNKGDYVYINVYNTIWAVEGTWSISFEPDCQHENIGYEANEDGTHNKICLNEDCNEVIETNTECSYENGKCVCGNLKPKALITQKGTNLSYEDLIFVIDIFDVQNAEDIDLTTDAGMLIYTVDEYTAMQDNIIFDEEHAVVGLKPYKDTEYYYAISDGIYTRDLHIEKYYIGYLKLSDGSYVFSEAKLYTPAIYAENMLNKDETDSETKDLCVALLNFNAAAQMYFHPNTNKDDLVNNILPEEDRELDWSNVELNLAPEIPEEVMVERDTSVFTATGKNLLFEEMISLGAIYKIDDSIIENAVEYGTIFWTAEQFEAIDGLPSLDNIGDGIKTEMVQYRGRSGQWVSNAPEIAAKDMADTEYYFLGYVVHADGTVSYSGMMSYTIEQYISNMADDAEMGELVKALYYYERAAKAALQGEEA